MCLYKSAISASLYHHSRYSLRQYKRPIHWIIIHFVCLTCLDFRFNGNSECSKHHDVDLIPPNFSFHLVHFSFFFKFIYQSSSYGNFLSFPSFQTVTKYGKHLVYVYKGSCEGNWTFLCFPNHSEICMEMVRNSLKSSKFDLMKARIRTKKG